MLQLRAAHARVIEAEGELLVRAAEAAFRGLVAESVFPGGLVAIARRRFGEEVRRLKGGGEQGDAEPVGLPESAPVVGAPPMVRAFDEPDDEDALDLEDGPDDAELLDDVVIDLDADEKDLAEDELAADDAEPSADAEIPEHELIPLLEIPLSFRNKFALGEAGQRRARIAFARQRRAEEAQRAAAAQAAEVADDLRRQAAAAARAARRASPGPAPGGWDGGGVGPGGGRRASSIGKERAGP